MGRDVSLGEGSRLLSERWNKLSVEEKQPYVDRAKDMKDELAINEAVVY